MIVPDVNLLLYATIDAFPTHEQAKTWWEGLLSGEEVVGIAPVCAMGFLRIATNRRVLATPMTLVRATETVRSWTGQPHVRVLDTGAAHLASVLRLLERTGTAGNLATDAQLAAHALDLGATVATNDTDFGRFEGVQTVNPLAT